MSEAQRPKIGVGVIIHDNAGNIVMGERAGSHGAGNYSNSPTLSLPAPFLAGLFLLVADKTKRRLEILSGRVPR